MSLKKCKDLILGAVMLAFSIFYYYNATQITTRPKLTPSYSSAQIFPKILGILLAIMSVILILQSAAKLRKQNDGQQEEKAGSDGFATVALTFGLIVAYTLMLSLGLGFCLSTILYLFPQMAILAPREKRNYLLFAVIAVVFTLLVFAAFRIGLQQLLPRGPIENLLGY